MRHTVMPPSEQRILVVEDDEEQAVLVRSMLPARDGYAVHWVPNASAARQAIQAGTFHAALVDLGLSEESGVALISHITAAGIPAIVLTGDDSPEAEQQALRAGAADYLVKGEVTASTLRRTLRYTAEQGRSRLLLERREHSLRELASQRAHLAAIVQSSDDAIYSQTLDGIVLSWNAGAERLYGYSADEMIGRSFTLLEPPERAGEILTFLGRLRRGELVQRVRTQRRCKDGTHLDVSVTMSAVRDESGDVTSVCTVARDITQQMRTELTLLESEALHRAMFDEAPVGVALLDRNGRCLRANARLVELLGYDLDALLDVPIADVAPPEDAARDLAVARQLWSGAVARHSEERRLRCADGASIWARVTATVPRRREEAMGFLVVVEDITQGRLTQTELAQIFELSPDMLCTASLEGYLTKVNPAFTQVLGFSAEELMGRPFIDFVHPDDRAATSEQVERLRRGEQTFGFTNRYVTDAGTYRTLAWHARYDPVAGVIYAVARDQTEQQHLEEQVRQMQKVDAVGQLAGGVAHDFNNILTAIVGFGELALYSLHAGDPAHREVSEILKAADSASALTRQLLAFSRRQLLRPEALDVETVVRDTAGMLGRLVGAPVDLSVRCRPDIPHAHADRGQLQQVLLNLVVNARDAMPDGGTVTIEVDAADVDEAYAGLRPGMRPGAYITLSVSDNGIGMSEQVRRRLFEPFFTTKARGTGTGLGLATVYGIVKQSGGYISVYSEPGTGSTFKVYLPQAASAVPTGEEPLPPVAPTGGHETVLVVEDQDDVRRVICEVLTRHGYTAIAVGTGQQALEAIERCAASADLLITDVVLPDLNGPDVASTILGRRQDLPVLYMSGYTENAIVRAGVLERGLLFLQKPFTAASLLRAVRAALDRPPHMASA